MARLNNGRAHSRNRESLWRAFPALALVTILGMSVRGQQTSARPDRGIQPIGSYAISDLENVSLTNGNLNLSLPLASLPPVAGDKLSWVLRAVYNSKLWNVTRTEIDVPLGIDFVRDNLQLTDDAGWQVGRGFSLLYRDSHEDFDWVDPSEGDPDSALLQNVWRKLVLRTPDGAEHELRPTDFAPFNGSRDYLRGYYKEHPDDLVAGVPRGPMRYYSVDGSFLWAVMNPTGSAIRWEVHMPDGTNVVQRNNGKQRVWDTNDNAIEIESVIDGAGTVTTSFKDVQSEPPREIRWVDELGTNSRVEYQTVGGTWVSINITWGTTTVKGKTYPVDDNGCTRRTLLDDTDVEVVREITLPQTESGQPAQKFTFSYNSDTTETTSQQWQPSCGSTPLTVTLASKGMGELSRVVMPSGAEVDYKYVNDSLHALIGAEDAPGNRIIEKEIDHDGITDEWSYTIGTQGASVTGPDGMTVTENFYPHNPAYSGTLGGISGIAGLVYRTNRSGKVIVERQWALKSFSGANASTPGGSVVFNPVVIKEFTTLMEGSTAVKMSAKEYDYDFNGNLIQEKCYDWFDPGLVTRDAQGVPIAVPASATLLRTATTSWYRPATTGGSSNVYAKRAIGTTGPRILNAVEETSVGAARTQLSYDGLAFGTAPTKGNLTRESRFVEGTNWVDTTHAYGSFGNRTSTTDPRGNVTQFFYEDNTNAQPTRIVVDPDPQVSNDEHTSTAVYDFSTGLVTSQTDPNGAVTTTEYTNHLLNAVDPFKRPGKVIGPPVTTVTDNGEFPNEKREALTKYFDNARQLEVISDLSRQGDQKLKSRTSHDELGRVVKVENSEDGTSYTIFAETVYREMGRITFTSNPRRAGAASTDGWTRTTSDALGRVIEVATFSGAALPPNSGTGGGNWTGSVTTVYNANETTVTDQAGKSRKSEVDGLGRLAKVIEDPGGSAFETTYSYDALGNLRFVNQGTQQREFTYDGLSRLLSAKNPEQVNSSGVKVATSYEYDDASNLKKKTNPNGATIDFTYDGLNRVKTKTLSGGAAYTFIYDTAVNGKGRLASVTVAGADGFYYDSYDKAGRVTQTRQLTTGQGSQFSYPMSYGYDLAGGMTKEVYPSGRTIKMGYDIAGKLNKVTGSLSGQNKDYMKSASYTAHGAVGSMLMGNDLTEATGFNSRLQPTAIGLSSLATGTIFDLSYKYGVLVGTTLDEKKNNGNVQSQEIKIGTTIIKQSYLYDAVNRLSFADEALNGSSRWIQSYQFDRFGNRTLLTNTGVDSGLLPTQSTPGINDATNRLIGFSYDTSGNVLGDGAGNTFTYDAENHQLTHTRAGSTTSYVYDGEGRRVKKESSGVTTIFVYNAGSQLIAEYTTDPVPPPAGGGGTSYLTTDHLGSTRLVTDQNRNVKSRRDYCPFGEELESGIAGRTSGMGYGQADGLRQKFTGKERDAESGLDYFLARYYSSTHGRFASADSLSGDPLDPQTLNLYQYGRNNPLNYTDPTGHQSVTGPFIHPQTTKALLDFFFGGYYQPPPAAASPEDDMRGIGLEAIVNPGTVGAADEEAIADTNLASAILRGADPRDLGVTSTTELIITPTIRSELLRTEGFTEQELDIALGTMKLRVETPVKQLYDQAFTEIAPIVNLGAIPLNAARFEATVRDLMILTEAKAIGAKIFTNNVNDFAANALGGGTLAGRVGVGVRRVKNIQDIPKQFPRLSDAVKRLARGLAP